MVIIDCAIILPLTGTKKTILAAGTAAHQVPKFRLTDTKVYVSVVTLSTLSTR